MPSQCYALVILFHFCDVFIRNTYFKISERVDLVVIKQIKPRHEIIDLNQKSYEIPKFLKTNVRLEISSFQIGCRPNFIKIKKLIPFGPKYPNLSIWAQKFGKPMSNLKSSPLKQGKCEMPKFGYLGSKF